MFDRPGYGDQLEDRARISEIALNCYGGRFKFAMRLHCQLEYPNNANADDIRSFLIHFIGRCPSMEAFEIEIELIHGDSHEETHPVRRNLRRKLPLRLVEVIIEFAQILHHDSDPKSPAFQQGSSTTSMVL
ncbi:hypothetical protein ACMT1E_08910 [Sphingomonas flavalba]|uniref:hypothetical protein n=1 Tax=Sphingomonas flavalba TaxID=2559804 RepID=UPI0039DFE55C